MEATPPLQLRFIFHQECYISNSHYPLDSTSCWACHWHRKLQLWYNQLSWCVPGMGRNKSDFRSVCSCMSSSYVFLWVALMRCMGKINYYFKTCLKASRIQACKGGRKVCFEGMPRIVIYTLAEWVVENTPRKRLIRYMVRFPKISTTHCEGVIDGGQLCHWQWGGGIHGQWDGQLGEQWPGCWRIWQTEERYVFLCLYRWYWLPSLKCYSSKEKGKDVLVQARQSPRHNPL